MMAIGGRKVDNYVLVGLAIFNSLNFFSVVVLATGNLLPQLFMVIMLVLVLLKSRHDVIAGFLCTGILCFPNLVF